MACVAYNLSAAIEKSEVDPAELDQLVATWGATE